MLGDISQKVRPKTNRMEENHACDLFQMKMSGRWNLRGKNRGMTITDKFFDAPNRSNEEYLGLNNPREVVVNRNKMLTKYSKITHKLPWEDITI